MVGLLDSFGLRDSLGSGGLLGNITSGFGGPERLQGLLLALGGNERMGAMLMDRAAQREAMEQFNRELPGIMGPAQQAQPMGSLPAMPRVASMSNRTYSADEMNPLDAAVATPKELSVGVPSYVPEQYRPVMGKAAVDSDLPVDILARQTRQESGFNPNAVSSAGARGISQFMPGTAREMGINPNDPMQAIPAQAAYLRQNVDRFGGSLPLGLAAYNYGPGNVERVGGDISRMPAETRGYVQNIAGPTQVAQAGGGMPAPQQGGGMSPRVQGLMRVLSIPNLPEGQRAVAQALLQKELKGAQTTDDIREYERAKIDPEFAKYMESKRAGPAEVSLNPVWGEDDKGSPVLGQLNKRGEFIQTKLPPGVTPSKGVDKVDMGTEWGVVSKVNGQLIGRYPKNIEATQAAEARGKAQGTAQTALPTAIVKSQQSLDLIDAMISHPGRETATGLSGTLDPRNYLAGTDATDFRVRQQQMQGRTFLEAFESLKGGGAITEIEGQKAEQAIARLNTAQSDKEYLAALNELKGIITKGMEVARQKAAGNFSDPSGWQDMGGGVRIRQK